MKIQVPFHPFFLLAILNNFLEGFSIIPLVLYRVRQNARLFVTVNASKTFFQFILTFFLLARMHYGLTGVYLARLFINIPYTILFLVIISRYATFKRDMKHIRQGVIFSLPLLPGALSFLFISTFDRVVLEKNVGLTALGLYSVASTLALTLNIIVQGLYRTFEQKIFEKHDTAEYPEITNTLYKYFITCLMTGGFLVSIFSKEVFVLFTSPQFRMAYEMVPLLAISVIISGLTTFLGTLIIADHKQIIITKGTILSVAITLVGTILLVRLIGVYGAILTSILSFFVVYFIYLYNLKLVHNFIAYTLLLLLILLGAATAFQYLDIPLVYSILLKTGAGALYFWICIILMKVRLRHIPL